MAKKKNPFGIPGWGNAPVAGIPQFGRATTTGSGTLRSGGLSNLGSLFGASGSPASAPGGGGNPYAGILSEFLNQTKANFGAQSAADAASRDAALRKYIISYGQVPDFAKLGISDQAKGFLSKALDPKTRQLAEQNTAEGTSIFARTKRENDIANRRIPAMLAGRGLLRSGQTGSDLADQAQNYKNVSFDQLNEMLGGVEGTIGSFLQAERARQEALAQAELQAQLAAAQEWGGSMYGDGGYAPVAPAGPQSPASASFLGARGGYPVASSGPLSRTNPRRQRNYLTARQRAGRM